jgi:hypothetical protein
MRSAARRAREESVAPAAPRPSDRGSAATARPPTPPTAIDVDGDLPDRTTLLQLSEAQASVLDACSEDDFADLVSGLGDAVEAPVGVTMVDEHRHIDRLRAAHQRRVLLRRREEAYTAAFDVAMRNGNDVLAAMEIVDKLRAKDKAADLALAGVAATAAGHEADEEDEDDDENAAGAASVKNSERDKATVVESSASDDDKHATGAASAKGTSRKKAIVVGTSDEDLSDESATAVDSMRLKAAAAEKERITRRGERRRARNSEFTTTRTTVEDLQKTYKICLRLPTCCRVTAIRHIIYPTLKRRFDLFCSELEKGQIDPKVQLAFHGTTNEAVQAIAQTGFMAPLDNPRLQHSSGDKGWYGNGIYLAPDPNISYWYARGDRMLICLVAMGKVFRCPGMMMGAHLQPGYTSHTSPFGDELVAYASSQVLPIAIIIFDRLPQAIMPSFVPARALSYLALMAKLEAALRR